MIHTPEVWNEYKKKRFKNQEEKIMRKTYTCSGCDGVFIATGGSSVSFCPYCGLGWLKEGRAK